MNRGKASDLSSTSFRRSGRSSSRRINRYDVRGRVNFANLRSVEIRNRTCRRRASGAFRRNDPMELTNVNAPCRSPYEPLRWREGCQTAAARQLIRRHSRGTFLEQGRSRVMSTHTATDNPYRFNPSSGTPNVLNRALRDNWWLIALRGLLGVIFGVVPLLFPGATILSLVLLFSAYMLVDGLFATVAAVRAARERARWGYLLLQGIASIATAVIAFLWPAITVVAFILLIAAWSIVSGCRMRLA